MVPPGSEFELTPETRSMKLQPGKLYEAKFSSRARDRAGDRQAIPSVARRRRRSTCRRPSASASRRRRSRRRAAGIHGALHRGPDCRRTWTGMTLAYSMYTVAGAEPRGSRRLCEKFLVNAAKGTRHGSRSNRARRGKYYIPHGSKWPSSLRLAVRHDARAARC